MSKKKLHYYVLVITDAGPKFVTDVNYADKTAEWDYNEKPLELDKSWAEDLAMGLNLNFHVSFVVAQPWEIDSHPYRYSDWKIEWKEREEKEV